MRKDEKRNQSLHKHLHAKYQRHTKVNENTRTAHALQLDEFKRTESRERGERTNKKLRAINTILLSLSCFSFAPTQVYF